MLSNIRVVTLLVLNGLPLPPAGLTMYEGAMCVLVMVKALLDPDTRMPAPAVRLTSAPPVGACMLRAVPLTLVVKPLNARLVGA